MTKDLDLTFQHALTSRNMPELKDMLITYTEETRVNPNVHKADLVKSLTSVVPSEDRERIIDEAFNKPNTRFIAHLAMVNDNITYSEVEMIEKFERYNNNQKFDDEDFEKSSKDALQFIRQTESETIFIYSSITRRPQYDVESMTSNIVTVQKRVRIVLNNENRRVIVYTGDRDVFNSLLSALTSSLGKIFKPLDAIKTGISEVVKGSFTFETVKFIDFIYNGLSNIGKIVQVNQVELESSKSSKRTQKVKVQSDQGDMLLKDKAICQYLLLYSRNLVGIKLDINIVVNEVKHGVTCEIGIWDNRIKIGIKKDHYTMEQLKMFFNLIEEVFYSKISRPGLINEEKTILHLTDIRETALNVN